MANNDKAPKPDYDPREWELVSPAPVNKAPPALLDDPGFQRQMEFQDFINSPEGEKWLREMKSRYEEELASERAASKQATNFDDPDSYVPGTHPTPLEDMDMPVPEKRLEASRRALVEVPKEARSRYLRPAPRYSQELEADESE